MAAYLVPLSLALLLLGAQNVQGDIYMHNPRGSNNKLNVVRDKLLSEQPMFFDR